MSTDFTRKCHALIIELGLGTQDDITAITPLTGGVSSDIARVDLGSRSLCVKFALSKLKVAADWQAPLHRNRAEYAWLQVAANIAPESAVKLFGRSEKQHGFVMEYLQGDNVYLWKTALLHEQPDRGEAQRVGAMLGKVHAASTAADFDASPFQNRDDFYALRIEPYLIHTAGQYPELAGHLQALADDLYQTDQVLVHGDASPKNILFRDDTPIILDAECATMGDAAFDPAFCLNHLMLKAVHLPASQQTLFESALHFWNAYRPYINQESPEQLEARLCRLLPALMLARIDGKSPVEYLNPTNRELVRALAIPLIQKPESTLQGFTSHLHSQLQQQRNP